MTETFSSNPENWREIFTHQGQVTQAEAGAMKTRQINQGNIREFRLQWGLATTATKNAIQADHDATYGGAETMLWTPPGETDEIRVRFKPGADGYNRRRTAYGSYAIDVGLVEATEYRDPSNVTP